MCARCMATAASAAAGATGIRAWLAARGCKWAAPRRLRLVTGALLSAAVAVAAVRIG